MSLDPSRITKTTVSELSLNNIGDKIEVRGFAGVLVGYEPSGDDARTVFLANGAGQPRRHNFYNTREALVLDADKVRTPTTHWGVSE